MNLSFRKLGSYLLLLFLLLSFTTAPALATVDITLSQAPILAPPLSPPEGGSTEAPTAPPEGGSTEIPTAPPEGGSTEIPTAPPEGGSTEAPTAPPEGGSTEIPTAPRTIKLLNEIIPPSYGGDSSLMVLPAGADLTKIPYDMHPGSLPSTLVCRYEGSTSSFAFYYCPVEWDLSAVDSSQPGLQKIPGKLKPEEGVATLAEGFSDFVEHYIFFSGPMDQPIRFQSASASIFTAPVIPLLGDASAAISVHTTIEYLLMGWSEVLDGRIYGTSYSVPIASFDFDSIDTAASGYQQIATTTALPEGLALPEGQTSVGYPITIVSPDFVDVRAAHLTKDGTAVDVSWIYMPQGQVMPQYKAGTEGAWQDDIFHDYGGWGFWTHTGYREDGFRISIHNLSLYTDYYYRLQYEGIVSDEVHVYLTEKNYLIDWRAGGGDNDGSDRDDNDLPPLLQPPPAPDNSNSSDFLPPTQPEMRPPVLLPAEPLPPQEDAPDSPALPLDGIATPLESIVPPPERVSPPTTPKPRPAVTLTEEPSPFLEQVTDQSTILSGLRLQGLLDVNQLSVLFEKKGIALELPSDFLRSLQLAPDGRLEVRITQPQANFVTVDLFANQSPLSALPPTLLRIPYASDKDLQLVHQEDGSVYRASSQDGVLTVEIDQTGSYHIESVPEKPRATTLTQQDAPPPPSAGRFAPWLLGGGALLCLGGSVSWVLRRKLLG